MSIDTELANEIVETTREAYTGRIKDIRFSFDAFAEVDEIDGQPIVIVSPDLVTHNREGHALITRNVTLTATMRVKQAPGSGEQWFSEYLDSWDAFIDAVFSLRKVSTVQSETRYELEPIHNQARLITQAQISVNLRA